MSTKTVVIYYSVGNNTKRIAEKIQKEIGADIARIETVIPYKGSYDKIVNQGQEEVNRSYKPEIKTLSIDLANYETVILGTPTWWYTMAPAVHTFIDSTDWTGKTVIPFMTNGGWPGHVIKDMKAGCKGAKFENEKEIQFGSTNLTEMVTSETELDNWILSLK